MEKKKGSWRVRILNRYDEVKDLLPTQMGGSELEELYKIASKYDMDEQIQRVKEPSSDENEVTKEYVATSNKILTASNSYIQVIEDSNVPFHIQIVVPEAYGTVELNAKQNYELSVWFTSLTRISLTADCGLVFLELCTASLPLVIDIFPAPTDDETPLLFRSEFENDDDIESASLTKLRTKMMKGVFPPTKPYIAINFDNASGLGKLWNGFGNPRENVSKIVQEMWRSSKESPPENFINLINEYNDWPK